MVPDESGDSNEKEAQYAVERSGANTMLDRRKAYDEFVIYLQENKHELSKDKVRELLKLAFQGNDLRYIKLSSQDCVK